MGVLITIAQLILSLSILIVLHEFGHFLPARLFGIKVEKFYLFFNPWFELYKRKIGDTEWGIGWLPLGGYVKIAGMMDESFDKEQLAQEPKEWEFRSKPAWQRLIVMIGGVTVNYILGILIFAGVLFKWGESYLPTSEAKYGIAVDTFAQKFGFQDGDKVLAINGETIERFGDIRREIFLREATTVDINRDGNSQTLNIPDGLTGKLASYDGDFIAPRFPFILKNIPGSSHNKNADLQPDDKIIGMDGKPMEYYHEIALALPDYKGQEISLQLLRNDKDTVDTMVKINDNAKIGVEYYYFLDIFETKRIDYNLAQSIPAGFNAANTMLVNYVSSLGQIFKGKVNPNESLGGFGSIGKLFGTDWQWERFWRMTAILSLILAFMNLLPIPALDGGHVMFLLYEAVTGRKPSDKFLEYATIFGFILVMGLVLYANGLDIWRWIQAKF